MRAITNTDDVIDSRDVIARIEELESTDLTMIDEWDEEELKALRDLQDEAEGSADWQHGETLIHADYFEDYARQLADDLGLVNADAAWPATFIDWEAAADALLIDYTEVDFAGETYYIRS